jgi:cytochrome P450
MNAVINPLFYFFPNLDRQYLWLFPKRKEIHQELEIFLSMVREIIAKKRETMAIQKDLSVFASAAGNNSKEFAGTSITKTEKDILELLIESAQSDENSDLSIADDDMLLVSIKGEESDFIVEKVLMNCRFFLQSNLCILFTAGHETTTAAILFLMYELAINRVIEKKRY